MTDSISAVIEQFQEKLGLIGGYYPEAGYLISGAQTAVRTSANRAISGERGTATRARMSIASSILPVINMITKSDDAGRHICRLAVSLMEMAKDLTDGTEIDVEPVKDMVAPEGWTQVSPGAFTKTLETNQKFYIVRKAHLPGGDWCLHYFNVPVAFAETVEAAALRADRLAAMIETATSRPTITMPTVANPRRVDVQLEPTV